MRLDRDATLSVHRFDGVVHHIENHPADLFASSRTSGSSPRCRAKRTSVRMPSPTPVHWQRARAGRSARAWASASARTVRTRRPALQRFHLTDDGAGTLLDQRLCPGGRIRKVALQSFGRQLDWRQRILDFVSQTPCHFAPRRHTLRPHQQRHIVEHENVAFVFPPSLVSGWRPRRDVGLVSITAHGHFAFERRDRVAR